MKIKDKKNNTILNVTSEDVAKQMLKNKRYEEVSIVKVIKPAMQKQIVRSRD